MVSCFRRFLLFHGICAIGHAFAREDDDRRGGVYQADLGQPEADGILEEDAAEEGDLADLVVA